MLGGMTALFTGVITPLFQESGLGVVISGLMIFLIVWGAFVIVTGSKD